jgi:hypothetical protein
MSAERRLDELIDRAPGVRRQGHALPGAGRADEHPRPNFGMPSWCCAARWRLLGREFPSSEEEAGACFMAEFAEDRCDARRPQRGQSARPAGDARPRAPAGDAGLLRAGLCHLPDQSRHQLRAGACRMVKATRCRHGLCDLSCIGYVTLGTAMAAVGKPYPAVHAIGRLALKTVRAARQPLLPAVGLPVLRRLLPALVRAAARHAALSRGRLSMGRAGINPLAAGYCALLRPVNGFVMGASLDDVELEAEQGLAFLQRSQPAGTETMLRCGVLQPLAALRGKTWRANASIPPRCASPRCSATTSRRPRSAWRSTASPWPATPTCSTRRRNGARRRRGWR